MTLKVSNVARRAVRARPVGATRYVENLSDYLPTSLVL
jgi:hypothetical protein